MINYSDLLGLGDQLLISHFVKYDVLTDLINTEFNNSGYNEINLCIDALSMIKSIYKLSPSQFIDQYSIASAIINACAHYRNFFWTRYKVTTKIWIVYSNMELSTFEGRSFVPTYGSFLNKDYNTVMNDLIEKNMNVLSILCPYIPDVSFIYSKYEPGLVFGRIALQCNYKIPTIIISKDNWNLQVVGNVPNTYMIRPSKKKGLDMSTLINADNVIKYYVHKQKYDDFVDTSKIAPCNISFLIAATSFPERNIKSIHPLKTIIKYMNKAIDEKYIIASKYIYDIKGLCNDLNRVNKSALNAFEIDLRMNAVGYMSCMYRYMASPAVDNLSMVNLHDPDSIKQINEKYFSKVPLDLMSL